MECFALLLNTDCDRCPSCLPTFQFDISEWLSLAVYQNSHMGVNSTSEDAPSEATVGFLLLGRDSSMD